MEMRSRLQRTAGVSPVAALAAFGVAYVPLIVAGYALKENLGELTIIWPASGILLVSLYLSPVRLWPALLVSGALAEVVVGYFETRGYPRGFSPVFPLANLIDGAVGASLVRYAANDPGTPKLRQVVGFFGASAIGAAAGALVGAWGAWHVLTPAPYWHLWQLWWAGNWLGELTFAPVGLTWSVRFLAPERSAPRVHPAELAGLCLLVLAFAAWMFHSSAANTTSLLHVPYTLLILLMVAAFRLPPRWATTLSAGTVLMAATFASQGLGPFAVGSSAFASALSLQLFLAVAGICTFMLTTVLLENRRLLVSLKRGEERYRNFVRHSSEAVWRIELREPLPIDLPIAEQTSWLAQHAYVGECSNTYESLHARFAPSDAAIDRWQARIPWNEPLLRNFELAAQNGYVARDLRFTLADGTGIEHWSANFDGVMEEGRLVRIWGVARNETGLISANNSLLQEQAKLKEVARTLRDLVDASPLPILIVDRSLRVQLWNFAAEALFGWKAEEVLGELLPIIPADERHTIRTTRQDRQYGVERRRLRKDGSTIVVNLWTTPFHDAAGEIVGQLGILADATEQKKLESKAREAQKLEALGTLAAGIAHDFNNILSLILGHASMARDAFGPAEDVQNDLIEIEKAAQRGASLVRQVLMFGRPQEQPLMPLAIEAVVAEGLALLRATLPKTVTILTEIDGNLPLVAGDPAQIHQVLVNLGINASHAMTDQHGTIRVALRRVHLDKSGATDSSQLQEGEYVLLTFADNGCGMEPSTVDRIFDPFFTTKTAARGTGLGLSVVRGIVSSHHGAVTVSSEPGKGTVFHLYFPATREAVLVTAPAKSTEAAAIDQRILYVDDEPQLVKLAKVFLERAGYRVQPYTDPAAALAAFAANPQAFDLVVTDMSMPGLDGIALTQRLLAIRPDVPVVICTGYADARDEARARACGARAVIGKPAAPEEICRALSNVSAAIAF